MTLRPKTDQELDRMREGGAILQSVHQAVAQFLRTGQTLQEIDHFIHETITKSGARPAFLGFHGYPAASCLCLNDVVVHGIPDQTVLQDGDILGVDIGIRYDDYYTDAAFTYGIGTLPAATKQLLATTQEALKVAIETAVAGNTVGDIGYAIEAYVKSQGKFGIVRDLAGHGVGRELQEAPQILNYANRDTTPLVNGMTLAIEPMITLGDWRVTLDSDNWTVRTRDGSCAAQFETTLIVRDADPEVLIPFTVSRNVLL